MDNIWEYLSGSQDINTLASYNPPRSPGGVHQHAMVIDSSDEFLYLFGGYGHDNNEDGTLFVLV